MARQATGQVVERERKGGTVYALRFRAYGQRQYVTLGSAADGWSRRKAEAELTLTLAQVERGTWQAPSPAPVAPIVTAPSFHEFASGWFDGIAPELADKTRTRYRWQLTNHLLPFFAGHTLAAITVEEVDRYRRAKVREGSLSAASINETITRLAQILEEAVEYGHLPRNPARGRRRRLKGSKPAAVWLDRADQIAALLDAAGQLEGQARADRRGIGRRALLATMALGGLRVGELCALRWRHVDLAAGRLRVVDSKTDAGVRLVDLLPALRDELLAHKAASARTGADELVFPTLGGRARDPNNVRERVLRPALERANANLEHAGRAPLPEGVTCHKLRHTFASVLVALGEDPRYVMAQLGHTDPAFTLRLYTHAMRRDDGERDRLRALVEGVDWAPVGTTGDTDTGTGVARNGSQGAKNPA